MFPIFRGYKLIDKAVQSLYGLVLGEKRSLGDTFQYTKLSLSETLSLDQRTLKSERTLHAGPSRVERPYLKCA